MTPSVVSVRDYGAVGDGKADDTAAILRAIAAAPAAGTVYLPLGRYLCTAPLVVSRPLHLRGDGTATYYQGLYGDPAYAATIEPGSVILSPLAAGALVDATTSAEPFVNLRITDLHLKGIGDATRTAIGIRIGTAGKGGYCTLRGLRVSNFKVGAAFTNVQNSTIDDLWVYGCDTGISLGGGVAANVFTNFNAGGCGDGVALGGAKNVFLGGSAQSSVRNGILVAGEENSLRDVYFENPKAAFAVDVARGADCTVIDACHYSMTGGDGVRVAAQWCRVLASKYADGLTITGDRTQVVGPWAGKVDDCGGETAFLGCPGYPTTITGPLRFAGSGALTTPGGGLSWVPAKAPSKPVVIVKPPKP